MSKKFFALSLLLSSLLVTGVASRDRAEAAIAAPSEAASHVISVPRELQFAQAQAALRCAPVQCHSNDDCGVWECGGCFKPGGQWLGTCAGYAN